MLLFFFSSREDCCLPYRAKYQGHSQRVGTNASPPILTVLLIVPLKFMLPFSGTPCWGRGGPSPVGVTVTQECRARCRAISSDLKSHIHPRRQLQSAPTLWKYHASKRESAPPPAWPALLLTVILVSSPPPHPLSGQRVNLPRKCSGKERLESVDDEERERKGGGGKRRIAEQNKPAGLPFADWICVFFSHQCVCVCEPNTL